MKFSPAWWFTSQFRLFHYWERFMFIKAKKQFWKQTRGSDALETRCLEEQLNWHINSERKREIFAGEMQSSAG